MSGKDEHGDLQTGQDPGTGEHGPPDDFIDITPVQVDVRGPITAKLQRQSPTGTVSRYDALDAFLKEIQQYPLLDPEEEKILAEHYARTGDVNAAARLVTANLRLVVKIAFEYRRAYRNIMDLIQEGNIGLMHAVKKFDPTRGVKLSSYSAWWIRAYILRFVLNNWRLVKLGTTQAQRKLFFNLNKERARLQSMGIEATTELLAERIGVAAHEVVEMEHRLHSDDLSLDQDLSDGEGRPHSRLDNLASDIAAPDELLQETHFDDAIKERLTEFAGPLNDKEDFIFRERLISDSPKTLQEIGAEFGVSRERVRQIEKRLLTRLRSFLETELPEYFGEDEQ
jgi:RNA polymerase sigma-32 factor